MEIEYKGNKLNLIKINHNSYRDDTNKYYFRKIKKDYIKFWKTVKCWNSIKEFIPEGFYLDTITIEHSKFYVHKYYDNFEAVTQEDAKEVQQMLQKFGRIDIGYYRHTRILDSFYKYKYEFEKSDEYKSHHRKYDWISSYLQRMISNYIRKKFVMSHNSPIPRNLCKLNGKILFNDLEDIGANIDGWDFAVFANTFDLPLEKKLFEQRLVHAYIWWMKYYSLNEYDRNRKDNIDYYGRLKETWEVLISRNDFQEKYWDKTNSEYKYFKMLIKKDDVAKINELMVFHRYWTKQLFLSTYIEEESKFKFRHEFKEGQLYKKYGRLRNNVVHKLREDEFIKAYNSLDKYFELFYGVLKDLHTKYGVQKHDFLRFLEKVKFNKYMVDYKQRIKIVNFVQERLIDLKIISKQDIDET